MNLYRQSFANMAANHAIARRRTRRDSDSEGEIMPQFDPELVQVMRNVLEEVITRVPLEISNTTTKAYLAECILKTAAQGHTAYSELLTAATDEIQLIVSMFT
ncbi:MAG: hypothetical protein ACLPX1_05525 [Steroidobacteraceae bacterium]